MQLLLGAGPALGREERARSLARRAGAPPHTLPCWGRWKGALGPVAFATGLGTAVTERSQPRAGPSSHPPARLLGRPSPPAWPSAAWPRRERGTLEAHQPKTGSLDQSLPPAALSSQSAPVTEPESHTHTQPWSRAEVQGTGHDLDRRQPGQKRESSYHPGPHKALTSGQSWDILPAAPSSAQP